MDLKPEYIERLAKILSDNGLTEISMEDGEQAITIRKDSLGTAMPVASQLMPISQTVPNTVQETGAKEDAGTTELTPRGKAITSPMVGTFYSSASPDEAPFVEIGSEIAVGDVVCIIEAMKLMNEIKSEQAGKVIQICVKNGDPVEFGQVLMYVE